MLFSRILVALPSRKPGECLPVFVVWCEFRKSAETPELFKSCSSRPKLRSFSNAWRSQGAQVINVSEPKLQVSGKAGDSDVSHFCESFLKTCMKRVCYTKAPSGLRAVEQSTDFKPKAPLLGNAAIVPKPSLRNPAQQKHGKLARLPAGALPRNVQARQS